MTTQDRVVRAHVERAGNFRFTVTFPDLEHAAALAIDEEAPLGESTGPNPAALLASAVGSCLAASLVFCLHKARVEPSAVVADACARVVRNDRGRFRIGGINVELSLSVDDTQRAAMERCAPLFEDFCIVTESVRRGVPVQVHLTTTESPRLQRPA